jgi:O-antigen chain-terminating methyltransferase
VLVTAFHVVEHLPFSRVHTLVKEALRVLQPGGLLILETPNPENPGVGAHTFYLDPTHEKPLPPDLLAFLPEHCGFRQTRILRLQEPAGLADTPCPSLNDVLFNASPDYAVVARKAADPDRIGQTAPTRRVAQAVPAEETGLSDQAFRLEDRLETLFQQTLGIDPMTLAARYDTALTARFNDLERRMDRQWTAHHQERKILADELRLIYGSRSWRITRPLRRAAETARAARSRYEAARKSMHDTGWGRRILQISRFFRSGRSGPDTDLLPPARSSGNVSARAGRKSGEHELGIDELLRRIRKEIDASRQKGDRPE